MKKSGPWSESDKLFIQENCELLHYEEIAAHLGKNAKRVKEYIRDILSKPIGSSFETNKDYSIKQSPIWKDLKKQFTDDELKMFLYQWLQMITQFKEDVLPTEEMQIVDCVKLAILMNRMLMQQQKNMNEIAELETAIMTEKKKPIAEQNQLQLDIKGQELTLRRIAQKDIAKDYLDTQKQKNSMFTQMKGTRQDRIKHLESSKESFLGWVKQIFTNPALRKKCGVEMEKMRLAMKKEEQRLSELHMYSDNQLDFPLLNSETITNVQNESTILTQDNSEY